MSEGGPLCHLVWVLGWCLPCGVPSKPLQWLLQMRMHGTAAITTGHAMLNECGWCIVGYTQHLYVEGGICCTCSSRASSKTVSVSGRSAEVHCFEER